MIKSANQYPVHTLFSHEGNVLYRIPPYQREYSWYKAQWEDLFEDLIEAEGAHFLGTIITLDQTTDPLEGNILHVVDGQQRLTTLTLLLAAVYSVLKEHIDELDDDTRTDVTNLGRQLVRKADQQPRVRPQKQGHNLFDYLKTLEGAGLPVEGEWKPYYPSRRIAKCYRYFRAAILKLAETEELSETEAALRVHEAALQAVIVKIEVASHADAFVLFESLNNRGMPLSPVDLIKNHLLAESEKKQIMNVDQAFKHWNDMLTSLGDSYSTQERFLRHYYNAFKTELPDVPNASVATKSNLIRVYEKLLEQNLKKVVDALVEASKIYGRINCVVELDQPTSLDRAFQRLMRAQGAPSYVLLMWLMTKQDELELTDAQVEAVVDRLTNFFVRRNLTGYPPTYALAKLFMTTIDAVGDARGNDVLKVVREKLNSVSASDEEFRARLLGRIYEENTDVARFVLTTLAEDAMTKETWADLWRQEKNHFVWTIEHILPQGENLPAAWQEMLGGKEVAAQVQEEHRHRLGNLTITAYNSNLGNKSFVEKRDRQDSKGLPIGYKNGFSLNAELATRESWTADDIEARTKVLADKVIGRFPLA
ncbi:DUF262 domain-containing HNH endonuclease family protein [Micrococcus luteus]|nr:MULTISPECIES: DUF262 domain-containing protein [Micrococcus]EZP53598.1 hypothetical protein BW40_01659 [Micrococcus luteus]MCV7472498.1 DUF262 domain-containing HNH endonuclease family protein [Micrococcus luteus]MCV7487716.1 DUF262 domain-containing HNH endonuclease family protein [Micrococcus luteus]MCV7600275.1 DUF262 domain-containing HNH endonuclease family protein [Micrococcus luteus]NME17495.1 DUF262 domain-containing protein [Micrococcus luteus]